MIRSQFCPLVSVVIPCLNRADLLIPTIESVLEQDYARLECIVVDGGSTDGTLDVLRRYEGKLRWVSEPDHGPPDAINKGWKMCRGEILAWLNADDLWTPGAVRAAVAYLEQRPDVDVVYGDCGIIDREGKRMATAYLHDWDLQYAVENCDHVIYQAAAFMRRSILEKAGWLWPELCHDHELWLRVSLIGGKIQHVPAVLACARHHRDNLGYQPEIVIPLKRAITERFFENTLIPEELKSLRQRALSNACLRGIDYVFLSAATCSESVLRSFGLLQEAIKADPSNLVGAARFLLRVADMIAARMLKQCLPGQTYERLRAVKRYLFTTPPGLFWQSSRASRIEGHKRGVMKFMEASLKDRQIAEVESFWDRRPCNIRHSPKEIGTRDYFDEVEKRKYFVEPHIPRFTEFERWRGKKVLEIGCGIGTDTVNFARHGAQVAAVDLSACSLKIARQRARILGLTDRVKFYHADAEELTASLPIEPYDLIYSFGVVHHTPRPERAVQQMTSYVRPGTAIKIMVYHRYSWKVLWILLNQGRGRFWRHRELIAEYSEAQEACPVTFTFTKKEITRLLMRQGFEVVQARVEHIFPYRVPDYVQYRYVKEWYFRALPPSAFRWLERHFGWHLCVTAVAR